MSRLSHPAEVAPTSCPNLAQPINNRMVSPCCDGREAGDSWGECGAGSHIWVCSVVPAACHARQPAERCSGQQYGGQPGSSLLRRAVNGVGQLCTSRL